MQVDLQVTALRCVQVLQGEQGTWRACRPGPCSEPVDGSQDLKTDQRRLCARLSVTSLSDVGGRGMWMETIVHIVHGCVSVKIHSSDRSRGYGCIDVHGWMAKCVSLTSASSC